MAKLILNKVIILSFLLLLSILSPYLNYDIFVKGNSIQSKYNNYQRTLAFQIFFFNKNIYTALNIGSYYFVLYMDLDSKYTIMIENPFYINSPTNTSVMSNYKSEIEYNNLRIMGNEAKDRITFLDVPTSLSIDLSFFIIDRTFFKEKSKYGALGLATSLEEPKYSILHQLLKNNLIGFLTFSLVIEYNDRPYLVFGTNPKLFQRDKNDKHRVKYCNVIGKGSKWSCEFNELFIKFTDENSVDYFHHVNTVKAPARFSLKEWNILVPRIVYKELVDQVLFKATKSDNCEFELMPGSNLNELKCSCSIREKFLETRIVFDNMEHVLTEGDMFWYIDFFQNKCIFNVGVNMDGDGWVFGYAYLKEFKHVLFDYYQRTIFFSMENIDYNNEDNENVDGNSKKTSTRNVDQEYNNSPVIIQNILIAIILFILITSSVVLLYVKYTINQSNQRVISINGR